MAGAIARAELTEVPRSNKSSWKWVNKTVIVVGVAGVTALTVAARIYEQIYAWKAGLDATAPEFQTYWMHMLYAIFAFEAILSAGLWGYVWFSRPKDLDHLEPREELRRVGVALSMIFVYLCCVYRRQLLRRAGRHLASDGRPRHLVYAQPHNAFLWKFSAFHYSRDSRLSVHEDAVATLRSSAFAAFSDRGHRAIYAAAGGRLQRMGAFILDS
jgi:hypothetical protein